MVDKPIIKQAEEAIRALSAENDLLKMAEQKNSRVDALMKKLVDSCRVKTADEYIETREKMANQDDLSAVEKAYDLFEGGIGEFGKVANEPDRSALSAEDQFLDFILS